MTGRERKLNSRYRRIWAWMLAVVMIVTSMPISVFGAEVQGDGQPVITEEAQETEAPEEITEGADPATEPPEIETPEIETPEIEEPEAEVPDTEVPEKLPEETPEQQLEAVPEEALGASEQPDVGKVVQEEEEALGNAGTELTGIQVYGGSEITYIDGLDNPDNFFSSLWIEYTYSDEAGNTWTGSTPWSDPSIQGYYTSIDDGDVYDADGNLKQGIVSITVSAEEGGAVIASCDLTVNVVDKDTAFEQAQAMDSGTEYSSQIKCGMDMLYKFTPETTGKYSFSAQYKETQYKDLWLNLYLDTGEQEAAAGSLNASVIRQELTAQSTYYLRVISKCEDLADVTVRIGQAVELESARFISEPKKTYIAGVDQWIYSDCEVELTYTNGNKETVRQNCYSKEGYYISTDVGDLQDEQGEMKSGNFLAFVWDNGVVAEELSAPVTVTALDAAFDGASEVTRDVPTEMPDERGTYMYKFLPGEAGAYEINLAAYAGHEGIKVYDENGTEISSGYSGMIIECDRAEAVYYIAIVSYNPSGDERGQLTVNSKKIVTDITVTKNPDRTEFIAWDGWVAWGTELFNGIEVVVTYSDETTDTLGNYDTTDDGSRLRFQASGPIEGDAMRPGTYSIDVWLNTDTVKDTFEMTVVGLSEVQEAASPMKIDTDYSNPVQVGKDVLYKFTPAEAGTYKFTAQHKEEQHETLHLELYDSSGQSVNRNIQYNIATLYQVLEAGKTYYLCMTSDCGDAVDATVSVTQSLGLKSAKIVREPRKNYVAELDDWIDAECEVELTYTDDTKEFVGMYETSSEGYYVNNDTSAVYDENWNIKSGNLWIVISRGDEEPKRISVPIQVIKKEDAFANATAVTEGVITMPEEPGTYIYEFIPKKVGAYEISPIGSYYDVRAYDKDMNEIELGSNDYAYHYIQCDTIDESYYIAIVNYSSSEDDMEGRLTISPIKIVDKIELIKEPTRTKYTIWEGDTDNYNILSYDGLQGKIIYSDKSFDILNYGEETDYGYLYCYIPGRPETLTKGTYQATIKCGDKELPNAFTITIENVDFNEAIAGAADIKAGEDYTVNAQPGNDYIYKFVPGETGKYNFRAEDAEETSTLLFFQLYDAEGQRIEGSVGDGFITQFQPSLNADNTYYLRVATADNHNRSADIDFSVNKALGVTSIELEVPEQLQYYIVEWSEDSDPWYKLKAILTMEDGSKEELYEHGTSLSGYSMEIERNFDYDEEGLKILPGDYTITIRVGGKEATFTIHALALSKYLKTRSTPLTLGEKTPLQLDYEDYKSFSITAEEAGYYSFKRLGQDSMEMYIYDQEDNPIPGNTAELKAGETAYAIFKNYNDYLTKSLVYAEKVDYVLERIEISKKPDQTCFVEELDFREDNVRGVNITGMEVKAYYSGGTEPETLAIGDVSRTGATLGLDVSGTWNDMDQPTSVKIKAVLDGKETNTITLPIKTLRQYISELQPGETEELTLNLPYKVRMEGGRGKLYGFVPEATGKYSFYSKGEEDTFARLYDSAGNAIVHNDDSGEGTNFSLTYQLTEGVQYYYLARPYESDTIETTLYLEKSRSYTDLRVIQAPKKNNYTHGVDPYDIDYSGLKLAYKVDGVDVTCTYGENSFPAEIELRDWNCDDDGFLNLGSHIFDVTLGGLSTEFTITVVPPDYSDITGFKVVSPPKYTEYLQGSVEGISTEGLAFEITDTEGVVQSVGPHYKDSQGRGISFDKIMVQDLVPGDNTITASYAGRTATFKVTVKALSEVAATPITLGEKTGLFFSKTESYRVFSYTPVKNQECRFYMTSLTQGGRVLWTCVDKAGNRIDEGMAEDFITSKHYIDLQRGRTYYFIITNHNASNKAAFYEMLLEEPLTSEPDTGDALIDITIEKPPANTTYTVEDRELDYTGMRVTAFYENGEERVLEGYDEEEYTDAGLELDDDVEYYRDLDYTRMFMRKGQYHISIRERNGYFMKKIPIEVTDSTDISLDLSSGRWTPVQTDENAFIRNVTVETSGYYQLSARSSDPYYSKVIFDDVETSCAFNQKKEHYLDPVYLKQGATYPLIFSSGNDGTAEYQVEFRLVPVKEPASLTITKDPDKTSFVRYIDELDFGGMEVTAAYADGSEPQTFTIPEGMDYGTLEGGLILDTNGGGYADAGTYQVTATLLNKSADFDYEIVTSADGEALKLDTKYSWADLEDKIYKVEVTDPGIFMVEYRNGIEPRLYNNEMMDMIGVINGYDGVLSVGYAEITEPGTYYLYVETRGTPEEYQNSYMKVTRTRPIEKIEALPQGDTVYIAGDNSNSREGIQIKVFYKGSSDTEILTYDDAENPVSRFIGLKMKAIEGPGTYTGEVSYCGYKAEYTRKVSSIAEQASGVQKAEEDKAVIVPNTGEKASYFSFTPSSTGKYVMDVSVYGDNNIDFSVVDDTGEALYKGYIDPTEPTPSLGLQENETYYLIFRPRAFTNTEEEYPNAMFTLSCAPEQAAYSLDSKQLVYNGKAQKPIVEVIYQGNTLTEGTDYTITCSNNINAGYASAVIKPAGTLSFPEVAFYYPIEAKPLTDSMVGTIGDQLYTGQEINPDVEVKDDDKVLVKGQDYDIVYYNNKEAGTAEAYIYGINNYTTLTDIKRTFQIKRTTVDMNFVTAAKVADCYYTGKAITPSVTLTYGDFTLREDVDYTLSYAGNTKPGTATITVRGKGVYQGEKKITFKIIGKKVTKISLNATSRTVTKGSSYTLKATISPSDAYDKGVTWKSSNTKVATVSSTGVVKAVGNGKATITATAKDGSKKTATCTITVPYKITYVLNKGIQNKSNPATFYGNKVNLKAPTRKKYTFSGWYTDKSLKKKTTSIPASRNKDITLYAKWTKVTQCKATSKVTLKNSKAKTLSISYKSVSGAKGYEISYGTNSKFKGATKIYQKGKSKAIKKLKKGKTYYVRVRAYKLDSTGAKVYGKYSKTVKLKLKK